ncbi:MAG: YdcF family protein [Clostridiales bacterium]|nr:YdcF family protein [Clostridiales bacterium]
MKGEEIIIDIIGLACLAYGIFVYGVQSGTFTFLLWLALGVFFLLLAVGMHFKIWAKLPRVLRRIVLAVFALAIIVFAAVEGCIVSGFFSEGADDLDYIIVLGAQVYESGPSDVLEYRLDAAYEYLTENEETICIVSGGQGKNEPFAEAEGMYEYLVEKGIPAERILMETESLNTEENLRYSSVYFDTETDTVGIVTNNFHVFRSVHLAKHLGMEHVCGIAAGIDPLYLPNNMLREFFGVGKDLLRGNLFSYSAS